MSDSRSDAATDSKSSSDLNSWTLSKIDLRSPVMPSAWPVARLELRHPLRGPVTDIGTAPGAFEAAFAAAKNILGISPTLLSYNVCSVAPDAENSLSIRVDIELQSGEQVALGTCFGVDLMRCSLSAWLAAASQLDGRSGSAENKPIKSRPHQVSAVDGDDGLWVYASKDESAARSVAARFEQDGYSNIRRLNP